MIPGLSHAGGASRSRSSSAVDSLSAPSGFISNKRPADASPVRMSSASGVGSSLSPMQVDEHDGERPRKRLNRGALPESPDPLNLLNAPGSPEIIRPGQRRKVNNNILSSSISSDESFLESTGDFAGPSKPRLVRGERASSPTPRITPDHTPVHPQNDAKFNMFRFSHPEHAPTRVVAAWQHSGGDEARATTLLNDASWQPPSPKPSPIVTTVKRTQTSAELGRVKEVEDATKAERARVREMGKKSMIYAKPGSSATPVAPVAKAVPNLVKSSSYTPTSARQSTPPTPDSPEVVRAPGKRFKRKVIESDSEGDYASSDDDNDEKSEGPDPNEIQALEHFNSATPEALQELTGKYYLRRIYLYSTIQCRLQRRAS